MPAVYVEQIPTPTLTEHIHNPIDPVRKEEEKMCPINQRVRQLECVCVRILKGQSKELIVWVSQRS